MEDRFRIVRIQRETEQPIRTQRQSCGEQRCCGSRGDTDIADDSGIVTLHCGLDSLRWSWFAIADYDCTCEKRFCVAPPPIRCYFLNIIRIVQARRILDDCCLGEGSICLPLSTRRVIHSSLQEFFTAR